MDVIDIATLLLIMIGLAAIPSSSVALVVARSATRGIGNGIAASLGIAAGDLIFVLTAITGLSALAETMGAFFGIVRCAAAGYLIWFGVALIRSAAASGPDPRVAETDGVTASFVSGLALTLGDIKAVLFYASLFPAFVDVPALSRADIALLIGITAAAVGGVKIAYAFAARSIASAIEGFAHERKTKMAAGGLMIGVGGYLVAKT